MAGEIISVRTQTTIRRKILWNLVSAEFSTDLGQFAPKTEHFKVSLLMRIG
jgi:hypothetical protein